MANVVSATPGRESVSVSPTVARSVSLPQAITQLRAILSAIAILACSATSPPITQVVGTWGGDDAGLIVSNTDVHVHVGCTLGDAVGPIRTDPNGRFEAIGTYNVDAYPVDRGILHPASFKGQIIGQTLTLTISLTDTARVIGPVTLIYGREPKMAACPICRTPKGMRDRRISPSYPRSSTTRSLNLAFRLNVQSWSETH